MSECSSLKENLARCPCTWPDCARKGHCCECLHYHLASRELAACAFPAEMEKTYDRSFERFAKLPR